VFVLIAVKNVKFHSDQQEIDLSTAESVGLREDRPEQKTAVAEETAEETVTEDSRRIQKILIFKF
jgi:hypothetical protein